MSRWEDLPPVDLEGYLADAGRNFLQETDQRISRLGLPSFVNDTTQKIQGLGSGLSSMYSGLQDQLAGLGSMAQQTGQNLTRGFTDYADQQIATLGQGLNDLTSGPDSGAPSAATGAFGTDWEQLQQDMGQGLDTLESGNLGLVTRNMGPLGNLPRAVRSGVKSLGASAEQATGYRQGVQGGLNALEQGGSPLNQLGDVLGTAGNALGAATTALSAPLRAGGAAMAGSQFEDKNLGAPIGVNDDTFVLGGLLNPVRLGETIGEFAAPASLIDDVAEVVLKSGLRVGRPLVERFVRELGSGAVERALGQGLQSVTTLFDDFVARAAERVPEGLGGAEGALGRLLTEEEGGLRTPRFPGQKAPEPVPITPGVPETPGPSLPQTASEVDRAFADRQRTKAQQLAAAQTPVRPGRLPEGSVLSTFDRFSSGLRERVTDETARLGDVQAEVERRLHAQGRTLADNANALLRRRTYAGRQAAYAARVEDDLLPHLEGLTPGASKDAEATLEQLDNAGRARAVQNRVTAEAAGTEVGPVAGETALRNTNQSLRMRRGSLATALNEQDAADTAARQAQADLRRIRVEGRREVRGSQGRGRRRVQRTPAEQAQVEQAAQARLDAARQRTVDTRAAAKEAARAANVNLSKVTRADLKRLRLEWETDAARAAKEAEIAEGAAEQGANAAASRQFSGGVSGDYSEQSIWDATERDIQQRLDAQYAPQGRTATAPEVAAEVRKVRTAVEGVQAYSRSLRETMLNAGMISRELYDRWERDFPNYIRSNILERLEAEAATPTPGGAQRFTVNSLTGGGMNLGARMTEGGTTALREQPVNTLIRMTAAVETIARRNEAAKALENLVASDPSGELATVFRPLKAGESAPAKHTVFSVYKDGEPVRYAVPDRFKSLFALDEDAARKGLGLVGDWLGAGVLKAGATTYNPGFVALNAMRDAQVYLRRSIDQPGQTGQALKDLQEAYRDLVATGGRGPVEWREALRAGAGQSDAFSGLTPQQVREKLLREGSLGGRARVIRTPKDLLGATGDVLGEHGASPFSWIRRGGELAETAPRLAAYRRALRQGRSAEEAALAARDITLDFSRGGRDVRSLNRLIPFLNAAVQGQERFAMDWLHRPKQTAIAAAAGVLLPTVAAEAYNRAFFAEDYRDVPSYLKDSGIVVMLPGEVRPGRRPGGQPVPGQRNFLYIPLPQDMALLRGAAMRSIEAASGEDPGGFGSVARSILGNASPVPLEGGFPLPPVARVATELGTNRDIFRGRDIVPEYVQGRPEGQQATDATSAIGRGIGGIVGKPPAAIDYAVEGLAGGLGRQVLRAGDLVARATGRGDLAAQPYSSGEGVNPLDVVRGVPLAGDVVGRAVRSSGGQVEAFASEELNTLRNEALRRVDARLAAMPSFRRLTAAQQQRLRDQEYAKVNQQFKERATAERTARTGQRVAAQRRAG